MLMARAERRPKGHGRIGVDGVDHSWRLVMAAAPESKVLARSGPF